MEWAVLEKGVSLGEGMGTTTATGSLKDISGKEGNSRYKKLVLTTDGLEPNQYGYNIGLHIESTGSENFDPIDETLIMYIPNYHYSQNENVCKYFYGQTDSGADIYANYRVFNQDDTLDTVLSSLTSLSDGKGTWSIKNIDDKEIADYSRISLENGSEYKLVFTSSVCYISDCIIEVTFFDHEPSINDFVTETE